MTTRLLTILICALSVHYTWSVPTTQTTKTFVQKPSYETLLFAFDHAAAAYSNNPKKCVTQYNETVITYDELPCDYLGNMCAAFISESADGLVVSFRGTNTPGQLALEFFKELPPPSAKFEYGGLVGSYFDNAYKVFWNKFVSILQARLKQQKNQNHILFTGHSLGGALASLASARYAQYMQQFNANLHVNLITFGQPRVGNYEYATTHNRIVPNSFRVIHSRDMVVHLPPCRQDWWLQCTSKYESGPYHHGVELWYPGVMNENSTSKICLGKPSNEDADCSNSERFLCIIDHIRYFGVQVNEYGIAGCPKRATTV